MSILSEIQNKLHVPKSQFNSFGKYKFRNMDDIVEAVKPLLAQHGCHLVVTDEIIAVSDRIYVKATASIYMDDKVISTASAFAREPSMQKGMSEAQLTGATSTYARKYAMNGLLAIDDSPDIDSMDNSGQAVEQISPEPINQQHVQGAYEMLKAAVDEDSDTPDYERMNSGWSRLTGDERISVFDKFGKSKPDGATKQYKSIIKEYLEKKKQLDGAWV